MTLYMGRRSQRIKGRLECQLKQHITCWESKVQTAWGAGWEASAGSADSAWFGGFVIV